MIIEIAILILALAALLWATGTLLKALDVKIERKPAPLTEEEKEALKAAAEFNRKQTELLEQYGGGMYG